jgi:hypothetical protein
VTEKLVCTISENPSLFQERKSLMFTHCREERKPARETVDFDMEIKHFRRQTTLDLLPILRCTISYSTLIASPTTFHSPPIFMAMFVWAPPAQRLRCRTAKLEIQWKSDPLNRLW